jgi:hypothetical protein
VSAILALEDLHYSNQTAFGRVLRTAEPQNRRTSYLTYGGIDMPLCMSLKIYLRYITKDATEPVMLALMKDVI